MGRFDFSDPAGPLFAWSACSVSARFIGSEVGMRLRSFGNNYFLVILDGRIINPSLHVTDEGFYELANGLSETEHEITIVKRTEFYIGAAQFLGFDFRNGRVLPPPPASNRRIEIVGDSITCGFGNEGVLGMEYDPKYDNSWLSYGVIAARSLSADFMITGRSGFGIIRGYEGNRNNTVPSVYNMVLPDNTRHWDFSCWAPQVVVINLGTNDFSPGIPDREEFIGAYLDFVRRIHGNYPDARIICSVGPAVSDDALEFSREYVENGVVGRLSKQGNKRVSYLEFPHQKEEDGLGISEHPSLKTHGIMGKRLSEEIAGIMKWK